MSRNYFVKLIAPIGSATLILNARDDADAVQQMRGKALRQLSPGNRMECVLWSGPTYVLTMKKNGTLHSAFVPIKEQLRDFS